MARELLTLRAGDLEAAVAPEAGGALAWFRRGEVDLMRAASLQALAARDPIGVACFPLVPFSGRIAHGRLSFEGRTYDLPLNFPGDASALHGDGWQCTWAIEHADATEARLALADPRRGWPWAYSACQSYRLEADALTVALSVTNESDSAMPAGLGIHPWFDATPDATLRFEAERVYCVDGQYLFTEVTPIPYDWDFSAGRVLAGTDLVNGFSGWRGTAEIAWPERGARLLITAEPPLTHLVVYTPPGQSFFCVEPVTHAVDSFNLAARSEAQDNGTVILQPGESLEAEARFAVG